MNSVSRRELLKGAAALVATQSAARIAQAEAFDSASSNDPAILPLSTTSGVFTPPRGRAFLKFSFDFPEPSVKFGELLISARVYTTENTYAMHRAKMSVKEEAGALLVRSSGLLWAGGQQEAEGEVSFRVQKQDASISITANARVPGKTVKSIAIIVRGIPRGQISRAGGSFSDPHDDEVLASWPELNSGLASPLMVIRTGADRFTSISLAAKADTARPARFYLQPGPEGYRAELTYEREAWTKSDRIETPEWWVRSGSSYAEVARPHYAHVESAFGLKTWEERNDVPSWLRDVSLVVALHGAHWTGYIFNDYAHQLTILRWVAEKISPAKVLVFLPAWDGRYYWNYPAYEPDPRMGGAEGFRRLIREAQKLGFHLVPMFGSNVANIDAPAFAGLEGGVTQLRGDVPWVLDYVDWDNDRVGEANYRFMNLGTETWRSRLQARIASCIEQFGVDGYFLDIVGCAQNNLQGDMYLGTRQMVRDLSTQFPGKIAIGEMFYDALFGSIPVFQAGDPAAYPEAFYRYGRLFEHLSWPAPGRGSTGVHEYGFSGRGKLPTKDQRVVPTLTVVDDTYKNHRSEMEQVIAVARQWSFPGFGNPIG